MYPYHLFRLADFLIRYWLDFLHLMHFISYNHFFPSLHFFQFALKHYFWHVFCKFQFVIKSARCPGMFSAVFYVFITVCFHRSLPSLCARPSLGDQPNWHLSASLSLSLVFKHLHFQHHSHGFIFFIPQGKYLPIRSCFKLAMLLVGDIITNLL